ncbi:MAG: hypothetical protein H0V53_00710 [Rubrobacter sp.]|nr:hypothetical protein [Rubrobacter sp.]
MNSERRSELERMLSWLENALEEADSSYERDREALEVKYSREKKALRQALGGMRDALGIEESEGTAKAVGEEGQPDLSVLRREATAGIYPNGTSKESAGTPSVERFSVRREIENLLADIEPSCDVTQGEITRKLQERFPQHEGSIKAATVSSVLRRLKESGKLVLVSSGSGSEPNRYRMQTYESENGSQEELSELRE